MNSNSGTPAEFMKAAVLHEFGSEGQLITESIPLPDVGDSEVLIKVEFAGIGQWDIFEREGGYAEMLEMNVKFPYVLGSEGSGTIVSIGKEVKGLAVGDKVMATGFLNPKGGFYAEFATIDQKYVTLVPPSISIQEAGVISGVGITALRGLEDVLQLKKEESIVVFGASGGVGHLAVQLAKQIGARVFAIASGADGVEMVRKLGIENVVDGHKDDLLSAAKAVEPEGFDAALLTAGGEAIKTIAQMMKTDGRIAYPNGVFPLPESDEVKAVSYNGDPDADIISRFTHYVKSGNVRAHIDHSFPLEQASSAHLALKEHYIGKLGLKIS
ncbi:NADP-dependent oxidoreductase [uncultured Planococcus sp.]|uniref:NADP-dependent oxidoreductase n=1 Tax=uncultured Planococcus sp. TaxID=337815 RepID=UPI00261DE5F8|nr:NADP-dependent oxidoreductase [uncultured Planococcus sp.]